MLFSGHTNHQTSKFIFVTAEIMINDIRDRPTDNMIYIVDGINQ